MDGQTYAQRTVSVDQRVGERSRFKTVEAFLVEDLDEEEDSDGNSVVHIVDVLLFFVLPPGSGGQKQLAWFKAGTYLDADDLFKKHNGAQPRAVRDTLGFNPSKLSKDEVAEVVEGCFQWLPLAQVTGKVVIKKLNIRDPIPADNARHTDGSEIVLCRRKITDKMIDALEKLRR